MPAPHESTSGESAALGTPNDVTAGGKPSRRDFLMAATAVGVPLLAGAHATAAAAAPHEPTPAPAPAAASVHVGRGAPGGMVNVGKENSTSIDLYYEDLGSGRPVVLSHGWPLSGTAWEKQVPALLAAGYRVITYDRRGFGRSSQPSTGYDYGTFADDLHKLVTALDLRGFALVGHSMGSGEVAGYMGKYGTERARKGVLISALPFFIRSPTNPGGADPALIGKTMEAAAADRPAFLNEFLKNFYNADVNLGRRVSPEVIQGNWNVAYGASPIGTLQCIRAWGTDFSRDLARIDVPALVIHGNQDRILPYAGTAVPTTRAIRGARLVTVEGGPHGIPWTHADAVNRALLSFLA